MNNVEMETTILQIPIEDIIPNRFQPRLAFNDASLKDLANSIKQHGIIQPLVLRRNADKYEIIAGERRYKAARMAGLLSVPAIISKMDDNTSAEVAIIENVQRKNLSAIEEAKSYQSLLEKDYITQEELAKKMGLSQSAVANKLRLLSLDEAVQQAVIEEKISERHARTLLQVNDKEKQKELLNKVINERLTVKQLDEEIKQMNQARTSEQNFNDFKIDDGGKFMETVSAIMNGNNTKNEEVTSNSPFFPKEENVVTNLNNFGNINREESRFFRGNSVPYNSPEVSAINNKSQSVSNVPNAFEEVPKVNVPNYNNILSNAVDIESPMFIESNESIDLTQKPQQVDIFSTPEQMPNSFFNVLENEAVNMDFNNQKNDYVVPVTENQKEDINNVDNIEMLDDFSIAVNSDKESKDAYFNEILNTIRGMNFDKNKVRVEEINLPQEYRVNIIIKKDTDENK